MTNIDFDIAEQRRTIEVQYKKAADNLLRAVDLREQLVKALKIVKPQKIAAVRSRIADLDKFIGEIEESLEEVERLRQKTDEIEKESDELYELAVTVEPEILEKFARECPEKFAKLQAFIENRNKLR